MTARSRSRVREGTKRSRKFLAGASPRYRNSSSAVNCRIRRVTHGGIGPGPARRCNLDFSHAQLDVLPIGDGASVLGASVLELGAWSREGVNGRWGPGETKNLETVEPNLTRKRRANGKGLASSRLVNLRLGRSTRPAGSAAMYLYMYRASLIHGSAEP